MVYTLSLDSSFFLRFAQLDITHPAYRFGLFRHRITGKACNIRIPRISFPVSPVCQHLFPNLLVHHKKMVDDMLLNHHFRRLLETHPNILPHPPQNKYITNKRRNQNTVL